MSECGRRCEARARLEFDHVIEFARAGEATVAGIRLRCRGHNQYQAEQTLGAGFMHEKRTAGQTMARARAAKRAAGARVATVAARSAAEIDDRDVTPWLRALGFRADEVKRAAAFCEDMPDDASLEQRVRAALTLLRGRKPQAVNGASRLAS